ncbi:MAG: translation initiation factor IF-2 [Paludibacteraceae bacterium]|nr:translation initiation factor IF-2 [Paludibacteraceae bacterium]
MARLGKAIRPLNIGLSTAVEFLQKKGFSIEADPNLKITDEQEQLLISEFNKDLSLKLESERLSQLRQEEKKNVSVSIEDIESKEKDDDFIKVEIEEKPAFKSLGKIDLEQLAPKKRKKHTEQIKEETKVEIDNSKKEETPVSEEASKENDITTKIEDTTLQESTTTKEERVVSEVEQKTTTENEETSITEDTTEPQSNEQEDDKEEVFSIRKPTIKQNINVVGKIDLSSINTSTRPPKKTKEERKAERAEKEKQRQEEKKNKPTASVAQNNEQTSKKGKRARIEGKKYERVVFNNTPTERDNRPKGNSFSKNKHVVKPVIDEDDVQRQVKETLARLTNNTKKIKGAEYRRDKRKANSLKQQELADLEKLEEKNLKLTEFVTANELATMMGIPVTQIISTCMSLGLFVSINQRLDAETINIVAEEFGFKTEFVSAEVVNAIEEEVDTEEDLLPRPPIVTVMGHVDHGKTSLLDYIRKTNVIAGEAGGITQHIGAYNVTLENGRQITFLDTPGHEAFTAMRARGAKVTDIAIIIVAADDNVKPQTIEAINHASAAGVPIVFAINKIDKPGANPDKVKESLAGLNYLVEDWGGKYQSQEISAKQGLNIKELLEKVLLEADLLELKANPNRKAVGSIIESSLDKGRGYVATVLVANGTLKMGDVVLAGTSYGRIKAMFNERNQRIKEAKPSEPAIILGLNGAPQAGDNFNVFKDEHEARDIANKREQLQREQNLRTSTHLTLEEIGRRRALGDFHELNIIVKGDVDGSIEALSDSLIKLSTEEIQVNVIHKAVGQISESDVMLAAASNAIIIGFQVRPSVDARKVAEREEVDIRLYSIIYDAIEELKDAMEGMLSPEIKEEITATLEIRATFKISKVGTIAGCIVKDGKVKRSNKIRLIRDGIVIYTGELASLKREKDDVKEVSSGFECGLNIDKYNDIKEGDIIEAFEEIKVKKTL